jgi:hypothetical protein
LIGKIKGPDVDAERRRRQYHAEPENDHALEETMNLSTRLEQLEKRLLEHTTRLNHDELSVLLADDFVEFGASGVAWTRAEVIEGLQSEVFLPRFISDFVLRQLSDDVALVTYLCCSIASDQTCEMNSLRSSIWRKRDDAWRMVFHQGTRCP